MHKWVVPFLLVWMLSLSVPANGQVPEPEFTLEVVPHGIPIRPTTAVAEVDYTFTTICEAGAVHTSQVPVQIDMKIGVAESWVVATVRPATHYLNMTADECVVGTEVEMTGQVAIMMTKDAPAGAVTPLVLTATPSGGDPITAHWNETVGAYLNAQVWLEQAIWKAPPLVEIEIPLVVENFGNSLLKASARLVSDDGGVLQVTFPDDFDVPVGQKVVVPVTVQTPPADGYINRRDNLTIAVEVVSADDSSLVEDHQVRAVVQTQGTDVVEGSAMGPLSALLLAFLGFSYVRRRSGHFP